MRDHLSWTTDILLHLGRSFKRGSTVAEINTINTLMNRNINSVEDITADLYGKSKEALDASQDLIQKIQLLERIHKKSFNRINSENIIDNTENDDIFFYNDNK